MSNNNEKTNTRVLILFCLLHVEHKQYFIAILQQQQAKQYNIWSHRIYFGHDM